MTMPGGSNPMKGNSSANPFSPGGNPMSSGESGMAPVGDGMMPPPVSTPETTKPRQMPGGAPPSPMGGAPSPMPAMPGGTGDSNVPQSPQSSPSKEAAKVRQIRRDIVASNPDLRPQDAHRLAMQVGALQFIAVNPQAVPGNGSQIQPAQRGRNDYSGGFYGDFNDPRNPNSPLHPNHPMHADYQQGPGSRPVSHNPLAEHARNSGYNGAAPTLVGGTQKALSWGANKAMDWFRGRDKTPLAPGNAPVQIHRQPKSDPGVFDPSQTNQNVLPGQRTAPQPPPVRQRVIPAPTAPAPAQPAQAPAPRGKPAPPAVPNKKVQDPSGHVRDQRNEKDRARRKQRSNGSGDLGDVPRGRSSRSNLPGLTGSLVYLQAGE